MDKAKRGFRYWQWRVIVCSMTGYAIFYFVRKNFSFAMPMLKEQFGITNTSFGIMLTLVGIVYGVSKFANGVLADRTNARWHLATGLAVCALVNYVFGFSDGLSRWITGTDSGPDFVNGIVIVMAVLLVINNIFQGCGFPPCNRLMVNWIPPKELATKMSVWNISHSIGAALASLVCGYLTSWRLCFWIPAAIASFGVVFIISTLRDTPSSVGLPELEGTRTSLDRDDSSTAYRRFVREKVLRNPVVWLISTMDFFVYVVRFAILDWGPTFLRDKGLSPELSGWTIAIFEIAGCAGMICAGWISDRVFRSKSQRVCVIEMGLVAICMLALYLVQDSAGPVTVLILLALAGFFLYGPQALACVVTANSCTKKAASSAAGIVGLVCYISPIFTGAGLGVFSDHFGWHFLFGLMSIAALAGSLAVIPLWNIKDDGYEH